MCNLQHILECMLFVHQMSSLYKAGVPSMSLGVPDNRQNVPQESRFPTLCLCALAGFSTGVALIWATFTFMLFMQRSGNGIDSFKSLSSGGPFGFWERVLKVFFNVIMRKLQKRYGHCLSGHVFMHFMLLNLSATLHAVFISIC